MVLWLVAVPALLLVCVALITLRAPRRAGSPKSSAPLEGVATPGAGAAGGKGGAQSARPCSLQPAAVAAAEPAPSPILHLCARLEDAFTAERAAGHTLGLHQAPDSAARLQAAVRELIGGYLAGGHQDWREYVHWNDHHYVRNLVATNVDFELMVICWRYGQGSRVHNHAESHCWLTVLQGCVHELQYCMPAEGAAGEACPTEPPPLPGVLGATAPCPQLQHTGTNELKAGEGQRSIGYINDAIALHAVRVPEHCTGTGAVTLHLYSPPIRRVRLYEPDNDRVVQRVPGFFTVGLGRARQEQEERGRREQQQAAAEEEGAVAGGAGGRAGRGAEAAPLLYDI